MRRILTKKFFNRPTLAVARDLLGTFLVRRYPSKKLLRQRSRQVGTSRGKSLNHVRDRETAVMITEVEAYDGPGDMASHAHRGKTKRNEVMFGEAGRWYVYFVYGMHWMLNIVTGPTGYPAAILIRGAVTTRRGKKVLINGPARLTKFLAIDKEFNGLAAISKTGLWLEKRGNPVHSSCIIRKKRIGVEYAGAWAEKRYNFTINLNNDRFKKGPLFIA
ncbi:MAG: hypothetical protein A3B25_01010 [Candidatus Ryanbacteria bacterium RIFCSPLOWO2_01_FULL_48_26]|uniref:Putative 3-methyladenine DNA glycosylase n=1 Tax=Candidatus Ryanbacteria bacterium RIFCSPLOWO2_01_FULL_48_26 TaxID=1802126 RepID=A0A1G2GRR3_9BACT|nr:MAG: hypothetical protein A3B25_01010 [Candidatus Ryanbacteria bacterium RIFCSPLOWO2_01_FULL_48_26]